MMINDLDVARDLSGEEQAAVRGGTSPDAVSALGQSNFGANLNGPATQVVEQLGIGNVAVLVDTPVQLNVGVNVGQNIAPTVNVAPTVLTNAGVFF